MLIKSHKAHIIFPSHSDALKALPKLHGHTYKGSILSCVLKKRLEKLSAKGEGKAPSHAGRLIIRNLSWDVSRNTLFILGKSLKKNTTDHSPRSPQSFPPVWSYSLHRSPYASLQTSSVIRSYQTPAPSACPWLRICLVPSPTRS